jgi:hypothetical protein
MGLATVDLISLVTVGNSVLILKPWPAETLKTWNRKITIAEFTDNKR